MYIYKYTYIRTYINTFIYLHILIYIYIHIYVPRVLRIVYEKWSGSRVGVPYTPVEIFKSPLTPRWQRCIGCLELQVSFRNSATTYRALSANEPLLTGLFCGKCPYR